MDIFEAEDYKILVNNLITEKDNNGRGEYKRISDYLGVSSVLVSQIFKGIKDISIEQAYKLCSYFNFIEIEKKYFMSLVSLARAGTFELRQFYNNEIKTLRAESKLIAKRVKHKNVLDEQGKAVFYSDWKYSAVRLSCDLTETQNIQDIQEKLNLKTEEIENIFEFLLKNSLIENDGGILKLGPASTHIEKASVFVKNHHRNWRMKAMESIDRLDDDEIMYTAPMSVSKEVFKNLNKKILNLIDEFVSEATASEAEDLYFMNIDLRKMV